MFHFNSLFKFFYLHQVLSVLKFAAKMWFNKLPLGTNDKFLICMYACNNHLYKNLAESRFNVCVFLFMLEWIALVWVLFMLANESNPPAPYFLSLSLFYHCHKFMLFWNKLFWKKVNTRKNIKVFKSMIKKIIIYNFIFNKIWNIHKMGSRST